MQLTAVAALFLAALASADAALFLAALASADAAVTIPREHHARFLAEKNSLAEELAAWKNSPAGRYAKEQGYYKEQPSVQTESTTTNASDDHLTRFFLSKITVEKAKAANPEATFSTSTPFSLMTEEEFAKYVSKTGTLGKGSAFRGLSEEAMEVVEETEAAEVAQATSFDWGSSGCVAGVKNQGSCGSCWAFSAIGSLESAYCLKYGSLTLLSDQQVTNCDPQSSGCDGGWPSWALQYIQSKGGVCTQSGWPYTSGTSGVTGSCSSSCTKKAITITSITSVTASDAGFVAAINKQPVAVAVAAGNPSWKQYTGGVVSSCSTSALDHAVLAVGYDATSFRFKNQWGTSWGAGGFINLKRISSTSAACSVINSKAVYPNVA